MKKPSAGILVYRSQNGVVEVLLGHPGGPFWAKKDLGAWSVPKGEFEVGEAPLAAAQREFFEETGQQAPNGEYIDLGTVKRPDGKVIHVWAIAGDPDVAGTGASSVTIEWPPKTGKTITFPEIDRWAWIPISDAPAKMHTGQDEFILRLGNRLGRTVGRPEPQQPSLF